LVIEVSKKTARVYALEYMGPKGWDCERYGAQETLTGMLTMTEKHKSHGRMCACEFDRL
jgi:hypothetical protein